MPSDDQTQLIASFFHHVRSSGKKRAIPGQDNLNEAVLKRARDMLKEE